MSTLRTAATLLVALSLGFFSWVACDSTGTMSENGDAEGRFTLRLTDNPADLEEVNVTVDRVDLVSEDADTDDMDDEDGEEPGDEDDSEDEDDEIITLTDEDRTINLLQLQDGVTTTLADVTVPEGTYTQLRFVLGSENFVVTSDGEEQPLQVPSGMETGIKIILPEVEVENDGDQIDITLDFDVEESLIRAGASGRYIFKPTVKVKSVQVNGEAVQTVEVDGAVSSVDGSGETVTVDGISFAVTDQTEFDADNGPSTPAALQEGQFVEVEGTLRDDGSLVAREVEVEDDDEIERSITAPIESASDDSIALLGVTIDVTDDTEFDDLSRAGELQADDRVEVDYVLSDDTRIATEIEREDD